MEGNEAKSGHWLHGDNRTKITINPPATVHLQAVKSNYGAIS